MAKIVAEGSFKYLTDKLVIIYLFYFVRFYSSLNFFQDYTKKDVAELHYESKTKTETLSGDLARRVSWFWLWIQSKDYPRTVDTCNSDFFRYRYIMNPSLGYSQALFGLVWTFKIFLFCWYFDKIMTRYYSKDKSLDKADCGTFKKLPKKYAPTHVVTAISYGGSAHIVFSEVSSRLCSHYKTQQKLGVFRPKAHTRGLWVPWAVSLWQKEPAKQHYWRSHQ